MSNVQHKLSWTELKARASANNLAIQYADDSAIYYIFLIEGNISFYAHIVKTTPANSDQTDFETNYQPTANQKIINKTALHDVDGDGLTSTVVGAKQALDVNISGGGSNQYTDEDTISPTVNPGNLILGLDRDSNETRMMAVTADGRVKIATEPPSAPGGATAIDVVADSTIATSADTTYTITNGKTLTIQNFNGGGPAANSGNSIELYYDPNGNATGMTLIRVAYVPDTGGNFSFDLKANFVGNGTRRILVRRIRNGGGSARVSAFWAGYEE